MHFLSILKRSVLTLSLLSGCAGSALASDVLVKRDPSSAVAWAGYKLYYGTSSRSYGTSVNVGNQTSYTVTGLGTGTYYFAVTAYNATTAESGYSNEIWRTFGATTPPTSGSLAHSGTMTANSQNFYV